MGENRSVFSETAVRLFRDAAKMLSIPLRVETIPLFQEYGRELLLWNAKINLTRLTSDREIIINHFIDSLVPERFIPQGATVADIGSGAGFPGIPLKIVRPDIVVSLFESSFKKAMFLRYVIRLLGLEGISVTNMRAEQSGLLTSKYLVCIGRAVAPLPHFLRTARNLMAPRGSIVAMSGGSAIEKLNNIQNIILEMNLFVRSAETFTLPFSRADRTIIIFSSRL